MEDLEIIQTIVDKIELNLSIEDAHELSVHQLAEFCNLSPWHFQRLFKSLVGDTLGNYLRGRRLSQAAHLLANSEQNILDIAMAVGFNSHEALTRSFKTKFGLSPSQYRLKKPEVELNKKPVLTPELYQHFSQYMQQEPIISRRSRTELIGFQTRIPSPFMVDGSFCDLLEQSWYQLFQHQSLIRDRDVGNFYGLTISPSGNFDEAEVDYIAAIALKTGSEIPTKLPEGMIHYSLPETTNCNLRCCSG